uniref:Uncharacterized protein n=1 Tax=Rhodopseudomonas palustris (strain BisA53) TaxID=316055 RepID=Q07NF9_RHOP5
MNPTGLESPRFETTCTVLAFPDPAAGLVDPDQVLRAPGLSRAEKRAMLASWASDAYAVEAKPWLRLIPNRAEPIALAAILEALRRLDDEPEPPPKGGMAIRLADLRRPRPVTADGWQRQRMMPSSIRRTPHGLA